MSDIVLDASAVIAVLDDEPGSAKAAALMAHSERAVVSAVNLAEVVSRFALAGATDLEVRSLLAPLSLTVMPFHAEAAFATGRLRTSTSGAGLSLGDRACLALGAALKCPVVTADRAWSAVAGDVEVIQVR